MSKITSITVSKEMTINVGNYESVRIGFGITIEPDEQLEVNDVDNLYNEVSEKISGILNANRDRVTEYAKTRFK